MEPIINLTQHQPTPDQIEAGVVAINYGDSPLAYPMVAVDREQDNARLLCALNFRKIPTPSEVYAAADEIVAVALHYECKKAMIGGAPFLMTALAQALLEVGIEPVYAFSERVVVEKVADDGQVTKTAVFKHVGFVPACVEYLGSV